mmetsp:Transcript_13439/g.18587  ORF Transcript_13439/g.18587 Transcript_13439/m.18587 type:complete len:473 (+) Transcript_13439:95-1513(+)|eukprot:CAMPEP_0185277200 /NCGR_PEP_ID=MMETSP1359-20130426/58053_1 /TAXON_ID=552665 /ORGANISM="Bigelowiella longifila, Strain CCMP242" /LENGTH=472 /DNA_ID=CAMNT_0027871227 /DNA_START=90 /DNA_END=1508 /DNA_ORIENTATION=+
MLIVVAAILISSFPISSHGGAFEPCPHVDPGSLTREEFWTKYILTTEPKPFILTKTPSWDPPEDVVGILGKEDQEGIYHFEDVEVNEDNPYTLTNPAHDPNIFSKLKEVFPKCIPNLLSTINFRPVFSVGLNGTGQTDIAHHYHGITTMLLLTGEKIWALLPPGDTDCEALRNNCLDPFDVCRYYEQSGDDEAPVPACVQRAGETIVIPDAWYHGTCNISPWVLGWGYHGRRIPLVAASLNGAADDNSAVAQQSDDGNYGEGDNGHNATDLALPTFATIEDIENPFLAKEITRGYLKYVRSSPLNSRIRLGGRISAVDFYQIGTSKALPTLMAVRTLFQQFSELRGFGIEKQEFFTLQTPRCIFIDLSGMKKEITAAKFVTAVNKRSKTTTVHMMNIISDTQVTFSLGEHEEKRTISEGGVVVWRYHELAEVISENKFADVVVLYCKTNQKWDKEENSRTRNQAGGKLTDEL